MPIWLDCSDGAHFALPTLDEFNCLRGHIRAVKSDVLGFAPLGQESCGDFHGDRRADDGVDPRVGGEGVLHEFQLDLFAGVSVLDVDDLDGRACDGRLETLPRPLGPAGPGRSGQERHFIGFFSDARWEPIILPMST